MDVFLTGGTGYIGSSLLPLLLGDGHRVVALARSDASARRLLDAGAEPVRGDLTDTHLLTSAATEADGVIHLASPGDETSGAVDRGVADAVLEGLRGSGRPYLHTGGVWVHGDTDGVVDEDAPLAPPALTAWRPAIEQTVVRAGDDGDVRTVVIAPGIVYGHGQGLPTMIRDAPQRDGALLFPGSGDQHWTTVHVDDVAALYLVALTEAGPGTYWFGVNGVNPTVRELAEAASRAAGLDGRVAPEPAAETQDRLGPLAEAFGLDQQATNARARSLGWDPAGPSLLEELETGSYAPGSRR